MASDIYEIHIPKQKYKNRISVFLFKRKKKTGPSLEYLWPETKKVINGKSVDDVLKQIAEIIEQDSLNLRET